MSLIDIFHVHLSNNDSAFDLNCETNDGIKYTIKYTGGKELANVTFKEVGDTLLQISGSTSPEVYSTIITRQGTVNVKRIPGTELPFNPILKFSYMPFMVYFAFGLNLDSLREQEKADSYLSNYMNSGEIVYLKNLQVDLMNHEIANFTFTAFINNSTSS